MAFSLNAEALSKFSLRLIGALGHGEDLQGEDYKIALVSLNLVLEYVQRLGEIPINVTTEKIDMIDGTDTYVLSNTNTIDVIFAYARDSGGNDYKIDIIASDEYDRIYDKDYESNIPNKMLFERYVSPQFKIFPVPDNATVDVYVRILLNTAESTTSGTLDIPAALYRPVGYLLAAELAPQYQVSMVKAREFRKLGKEMLKEMYSELSAKIDEDSVPGAFET